jgi:polyphosphate kinase
MLARTHTPFSPWRIVRSDDKHLARLSVIKDLLTHLDYKGKDERVTLPNPEVVFVYDEGHRKKGLIAP